MTYTITKKIKITNDEYGWCFDFSTDEYGTVSVEDSASLNIQKDSASLNIQFLHIPKDCIQHFIDVLEQFK